MLKKKGVTLIEVMIAALILAVTIAGLFASFSTAQSLVSQAGRIIQAKNFAQQALEILRKEVRQDTWDATSNELRVHESSWEILPGTFGTTYSGQRKYAVTDIDGAKLTPSDLSILPNAFRKVTVTVQWQEP